MDCCWTPSTGCRDDFVVAAVPLPNDVRGPADDFVGVAGDVLAGVAADVVVDAVVGVVVDVAGVVNGRVMDACVHCSGALAAMVAYVPALEATMMPYFPPLRPYHPDGSSTDCIDYGAHPRATGANLVASVRMGWLFPVCLMIDYYPRCQCHFLQSSFVPGLRQSAVSIVFESGPEILVEGSHQPQLQPAGVL